VVEAMKLIATEGMESPLKAKMVRRQIDRDARRNGWTDAMIHTMDPEWQWRVCCARLQMGLLDWEGWEWRNARAGHDPFPFPIWRGEKVGKLLIYGEQGVGDEVMFAQCFEDVREWADEVVIECEPRLAPIFRRSFPWAEVHGRSDLRDGSWIERADAKVLMGDLCKLFRRSEESFRPGAYLVPDPEKVEFWRETLPGSEKFPGYVGVSWRGRQGVVEPSELDLHDGRLLVNLQYDGEAFWTPPIDLREDLEDVFAILSLCEEVITVPNTLAHMAGALGVPGRVWLVPSVEVNNALNWRWFHMERWHQSLTVYDFRRVPSGKRAMSRGRIVGDHGQSVCRDRRRAG
jgi:hypothetical protein